jgi:hydrogenase maturation protease
LVRSDDGVGPMLVRHIWETGVPDGVRLADGGTAGMDVAFQISGAREVTLVDACVTGAEAGTIFEIPGEEVETPPLAGMNLHSFRWDHALAFGRWLLKENFPERVTVFLIEAKSLEPGVGLTPPVEKAMHEVAGELVCRYSAVAAVPRREWIRP